MALPINIEDLLNKRRFEPNRIEFKADWNPDKIYHTICVFATDLENIGGGYILVGVEEEQVSPDVALPILKEIAQREDIHSLTAKVTLEQRESNTLIYPF